MKTPIITVLLAVAATASAQPQYRTRGTIARPRMNVPVDARHNSPHQRYWHNERTRRDEPHAIVYEHRAPQVIAHDRFARTWHRGYRPRYAWRHFYPAGGWAPLWGISAWNMVSGVTCEAANEQTGELFPVTANGVAGWNNAAVDSVLDQALDECAAYAGAGVCVPAQPACSFY
jgi:hypothetical protein